MDWTALVDGPLPNVFLRHVPALVVLEDAPSDAPLQSDVLTVENVVVQADEPSDADVLTVGGEAPMDIDNGDVDVDLACSSCSSASSMSCAAPEENFLSSDSSECAPLAIDEEPPRGCSGPSCLPIVENFLPRKIPTAGFSKMQLCRYKRKSCWSMPLTWRCVFRKHCCFA